MTLYQTTQQDSDPIETREWLESLDALVTGAGANRARYVLSEVLARARRIGCLPDQLLVSDYVNTIPPHHEPPYPGDLAMERRISDIIRWNAAVMVSRANNRFPNLGGHLSTYASSANLYDVGFHHFFRGRNGDRSGDQIFFQGHAAPGIYARSFLEGRLTTAQLDHFRRESDRGKGLSSYPHPRLMPDYWEFPTVSMGLGPIASIYQARFNRYLRARGIIDGPETRVWAFVGDGETDEPESLGALSVASREGLDNLTWVVNCNLQRLDGPVRGNGKIVQELETVFRGAGWNVIKVLWAREWDDLLARDHAGPPASAPERGARRASAEVPRGRRRLHPQALLRHESGAARAGRAPERRGHLAAAPRRARHPQDPRRLPGRGRAPGTAHGRPCPDGEGIHARRGLREQERHAPDEEAEPGSAARVPRPARAARSRTRSCRTPPTTTPDRRAPRWSTCARRAATSAAISPRRSDRPGRQARPSRRRTSTRSSTRGRRTPAASRRRWPSCACSRS